jgi:hypothetical protein
MGFAQDLLNSIDAEKEFEILEQQKLMNEEIEKDVEECFMDSMQQELSGRLYHYRSAQALIEAVK